ncbi:hypothetical protein [Blastococcus brunescens]|uniref:Uncharacterized protein n=1 Tax=Blastococcus brunescens TaxID=1564165 RepID=A0ABZ1B3E4_9ACTN|nr:hypothetical protein [Blastococcus sp. BMG 8361]WRL64246.1 hypothetical protein U6N30_32665 [Blastococcus sp. BMG 8361]
MTAAPPRPAVVPASGPVALPPSSGRTTPATQHQRRLRYQATLAGIRARAAVTPAGSAPRLQVCGAANLLTALGVRVDVVRPATPWPRERQHRLLVENSAGALGDLALLVGVPRTAGGWADVADRLLPVRTASRAPLRDVTDAVVCPVTIAYRSATGPLLVPPRTLDEVVQRRDLVIEVRLLPARGSRQRAA